MSILDTLSEQDKNMVTRLPYRVGLWVSQSDDSGGDDADEEELSALENIIAGFTEDVFGSEVVQYVMAETLSNKDSWEAWDNELGAVPQECVKALQILQTITDEKEISAFKKRLIDIGEAVALAFREEGGDDMKRRLAYYVSFFTAKLQGRQQAASAKTLDQYLNISAKEREALNSLALALNTTY